MPCLAQASDPLSSWNDGPAKQAIIQFVQTVTEKSNPNYVAPEDRIATFDQDGTLWVEHPLYTQAIFELDRVKTLANEHPEWKTTEPFRSVLGATGHLWPSSISRIGHASSLPPRLE